MAGRRGKMAKRKLKFPPLAPGSDVSWYTIEFGLKNKCFERIFKMECALAAAEWEDAKDKTETWRLEYWDMDDKAQA